MVTEIYDVLHGLLEVSVWIMFFLAAIFFGVIRVGNKLKGIIDELKKK